MSANAVVGEGGIERLLRVEQELRPPEATTSNARLRDFETIYAKSVQDP